MNSEELKQRTKLFGLEVIKLVESLPKTRTAEVIGRQLLRSGTSVGQIIAPPAAGAQKQISSPKPGLLLKKSMNPFIGWNYCKKQK